MPSWGEYLCGLVIALLVLLSGCGHTQPERRLSNLATVPGGKSIAVFYVEIEGMPCLYTNAGYGGGGITCDWSQWEGAE